MPSEMAFGGQEINITTYNLCRINMFCMMPVFDKFGTIAGEDTPDRTAALGR